MRVVGRNKKFHHSLSRPFISFGLLLLLLLFSHSHSASDKVLLLFWSVKSLGFDNFDYQHNKKETWQFENFLIIWVQQYSVHTLWGYWTSQNTCTNVVTTWPSFPTWQRRKRICKIFGIKHLLDTKLALCL